MTRFRSENRDRVPSRSESRIRTAVAATRAEHKAAAEAATTAALPAVQPAQQETLDATPGQAVVLALGPTPVLTLEKAQDGTPRETGHEAAQAALCRTTGTAPSLAPETAAAGTDLQAALRRAS